MICDNREANMFGPTSVSSSSIPSIIIDQDVNVHYIYGIKSQHTTSRRRSSLEENKTLLTDKIYYSPNKTTAIALVPPPPMIATGGNKQDNKEDVIARMEVMMKTTVDKMSKFEEEMIIQRRDLDQTRTELTETRTQLAGTSTELTDVKKRLSDLESEQLVADFLHYCLWFAEAQVDEAAYSSEKENKDNQKSQDSKLRSLSSLVMDDLAKLSNNASATMTPCIIYAISGLRQLIVFNYPDDAEYLKLLSDLYNEKQRRNEDAHFLPRLASLYKVEDTAHAIAKLSTALSVIGTITYGVLHRYNAFITPMLTKMKDCLLQIQVKYPGPESPTREQFLTELSLILVPMQYNSPASPSSPILL